MKSLRPETADKYRVRLASLLADQPVTNTVSRLEVGNVLDKLGEIKYKNYFSQSKNAFLHFCEWQGIKLSTDTLACISELERATKKKYKKLKPVAFADINKKIKSLRNMKLKLSFQAIIATGLRVSELAGLSARDCTVSDNSIKFSFTGKGGKVGTATITASDYPKLYERLKEHIEVVRLKEQLGVVPLDKKLFYSAGYLQSKATALGFTCHDLRRAFAKIEYKKCKNKAEVSEKLRHTNKRTTNIYLRSKVKI
ncbi:MAG: site-specific integrase [Defluviitaleaceae bacterium]|nr:site-specific integrase [Defluviitaleaceae bacterium]